MGYRTTRRQFKARAVPRPVEIRGWVLEGKTQPVPTKEEMAAAVKVLSECGGYFLDPYILKDAIAAVLKIRLS